MHDHFGIAAGAEGVAALHQLDLDFLEVEDLAVVGDDDRMVFVVDRLLPAFRVDDRETSMAEPDARLEMKAVAVRAAMADDAVHRAQYAFRDRPRTLQIDY